MAVEGSDSRLADTGRRSSAVAVFRKAGSKRSMLKTSVAPDEEQLPDPRVRFERLAPGQYAVYRALRLAALKESPEAFAATYAEASLRGETRWKDQADALAQASDRAAFVAYDGSFPVGLMAFYGVEAALGEVMQVWVSPRSRGTGVASDLLDRLLRWARAQDFVRVQVRARTSNRRAIRFYEKEGFLRADETDGEVRLVRNLK